MSSDKNQDVLEKHLKTLGQKIRIDILKKLSLSSNPLPYSSLQKEVLGSNPNSVNFSFHLKALKNSVLIESSENGYTLSVIGKQILKNIVSIEQILNDKNKKIMIRTSKYSKEPFDANKIEAYLIKEGKVEKFVAKKISKEVEERLSKTHIEYLTAPLMREYINAILLENGREEIRHKLTRLGTPPFEIFKHFDNNSINPEQLLSKLGSDVSEQFLLLNLLPKNLADLFLSGEVVLLNLNYWSLRPLGFYIDTDSIMESISNRYSINLDSNDYSINQIQFIMHFFDLLASFKPFFSEDILLGNFSSSFLTRFNSIKEPSNLINIVVSQVLKLGYRHYDEKSHLSLEISLLDKNKDEVLENSQEQNNHNFIDKLFYQANQNGEHISPSILYDYSKFLTSKNTHDFFVHNFKSGNWRNFIFYKKNNSNLLNSTLVNVHNFNGGDQKRNKIILDKVLINFHKIAEYSNQNDNSFFEHLQERLDSVFELFEYKKELINRKLKSSNQWKRIISEFFKEKEAKWIDDSLKSVSFFGFNEAIKMHCGIEIDRVEKSESFAYNILEFMSDIIKEKNQKECEKYILTQPHQDSYLYDTWHNNQYNLGKKSNRYSVNMVREDSKLSLKRKIELHKNFEKYFDGGSLLTLGLNNLAIDDLIEEIISSKLNAFQLEI
ncbi:MAG: anaerobic ribonucleoside-triphosphate reductase [Promethearchaeota archaeon]